jgi:arsenite methyltransferase
MFWFKYLGVDKLKEGRCIRILSTQYMMKKGILRQVAAGSASQSQTSKTFGFKWGKRDTYESKNMQKSAGDWIYKKHSGNNASLFAECLKPGAKVLDAGCGSGFSAIILFKKYMKRINYLGIDISTSVDVAAERFKENSISGEFIQADLSNLPFSKPTFDLIFSEGVLHHTDSTERSIKRLSKLILPGGRFMFYVYRKKAPVREYADDYIRNYLKSLDDKDAWNALKPLTKLGRALGELKTIVKIPEDIPCLGIKAGTMDIQRLFYWYIFKAFYKPNFTLEEMNHINFDWYRPANCHRHTPEEVKKWCREAGLSIKRFCAEEAGITVGAIKNR